MGIRPFGLARIQIERMVEIANLAWQRGWVAGTAGNFTVCDGQTIWVSPSGVCKGKLRTSQFLPVDREGRILHSGSLKVSEELPVHLGIHQYLQFPKGVVVHVHTPKYVELSNKYDHLYFENQELQKALGCVEASERLEIQLAPNPKRHEFSELCGDIQKWWNSQCKLVAVRGHGVWAWGEDPFQALNRIEAIEHLCEIVD